MKDFLKTAECVFPYLQFPDIVLFVKICEKLNKVAFHLLASIFNRHCLALNHLFS